MKPLYTQMMAALLLSGAAVFVAAQQDLAGGTAIPEEMRTTAPARELGVVVDLSKRQLDIRINGELAGTYEVAVGQPGHRTPTGTYRLSRVIWNPAWVPPDREWARNEERTPPGDPDNPMGRVKIYFDDLYYVHGTNATETVGEPVSHGCVRMRNEDAMRLARLVMEHGGANRSESWYTETRENRTETRAVTIPDPPLLRITP